VFDSRRCDTEVTVANEDREATGGPMTLHQVTLPTGNGPCLYRAGDNRRYPPWRVG
jgi:hypothetical protein